MKKILLLTSVVLLLLYSSIIIARKPFTPKLSINDHTYSYDIAMTDDQRNKGLSYRDSMNPSHGMLFVFQEVGEQTFWMYEMRFPLDFVWIQDDTVVSLNENVPIRTADSWTVIFSKVPVNRVLELNAGEIAKSGIRIGDRVSYLK